MNPRLVAVALLVILQAACSGSSGLLSGAGAGQGLPGSVELQATPFYPQDDYQCGPAALATVLTASGTAVSPAQLLEQVYVPGRRGSLQPELLAAARRAGRLPYVIDPDLGALMGELAAGRPVLILQNLGLSFAPLWHYAVVVGYDSERGQLILRSGRTERRLLSVARFLRSWRASEDWGMVVLRPGELPAAPSRTRFLRAASDLEAAGQPGAALAAYRAAAARWSDSAAAEFALANAYHAAGDLPAAEAAYRAALERAPDDAAVLNNLSQLLLQQGRCADARAALERGLAAGPVAPAIHSALADSARRIAARCPDAAPGQ